MVPRDHANDLTTYKVLVGGAVFLLIMTAVALSQASCDHSTHRALGWWKKDDAFTDLKANVGLNHGDATQEIRTLREKVKACEISIVSKHNFAEKLNQQLVDLRTEHKKELIAQKNAHDKALATQKEDANILRTLRANAKSALGRKTEKLKVTVAALEKERKKNENLTSELKVANDAITAKNKKLSLTGAIIVRLSNRIIGCDKAVNDITTNLASLKSESQHGTACLKAAIAKVAEAKAKLADATANSEKLKGEFQRGKANAEAAAKTLNLERSKKDLAELKALMMPQRLKAPAPSSSSGNPRRRVRMTTSSAPSSAG